ncbi:probable aldo-keto reductase 1 [Carya illinoinensis]|uniref:probable aldo-keto reductase 1 n=1 Tax=Carya illinoinensis TaxID=32201 RepID=UPI001C72214C|nr:probable aldo-keto reductase 1 [Carya illinoinensis]
MGAIGGHQESIDVGGRQQEIGPKIVRVNGCICAGGTCPKQDKNKIIYTQIESIARKHECNPAQLAIAWVLDQGDDVVPIPGTTKIKNLENNIGSFKVKLTGEALKERYNVVPIEEVAGGRSYTNTDHLEWKFANTPPKK